MNEKTYNELIRQLTIDEGLKLKPYYCPAGYLTIGIGRNLETNGLSEHEMLAFINSNSERKDRLQIKPSDTKRHAWHILLLDFQQYGITEEESVWLLKNDIAVCIAQLKSKLPWYESAPEEIQSVLVNMCFNMGIGTLLTFKNTLRHISAGQYEKAAENMLKSKWARQVGKRAKRLAERVRKMEAQP
jgi:lysozyme